MLDNVIKLLVAADYHLGVYKIIVISEHNIIVVIHDDELDNMGLLCKCQHGIGLSLDVVRSRISRLIQS